MASIIKLCLAHFSSTFFFISPLSLSLPSPWPIVQQENSTHQVASSAAYEPVWYQNRQGGIVHWSGNDWRDVILPAIPLSHLYTQQMSYLIHGLEPDRKYEAKVQARLVSFGRSVFS